MIEHVLVFHASSHREQRPGWPVRCALGIQHLTVCVRAHRRGPWLMICCRGRLEDSCNCCHLPASEPLLPLAGESNPEGNESRPLSKPGDSRPLDSLPLFSPSASRSEMMSSDALPVLAPAAPDAATPSFLRCASVGSVNWIRCGEPLILTLSRRTSTRYSPTAPAVKRTE